MAQCTAYSLCFCTDSGNIQDRGKKKKGTIPLPNSRESRFHLNPTSDLTCGKQPCQRGPRLLHFRRLLAAPVSGVSLEAAPCSLWEGQGIFEPEFPKLESFLPALRFTEFWYMER